MIQIHVTEQNQQKTVSAKPGTTLMESLRNAGITGIVAECGGSMSCASCHVFVDENWLTQTGNVSDMEDDMLDCTATDRQPGSRLSCQIKLTDALDGLTITVPDEQI